jgi:hypothetical protein
VASSGKLTYPHSSRRCPKRFGEATKSRNSERLATGDRSSHPAGQPPPGRVVFGAAAPASVEARSQEKDRGGGGADGFRDCVACPRNLTGFAGADVNLYAYVFNGPTNLGDPGGRAVDAVVDLGFIGYDLYRLFLGGRKDLEENTTALLADGLGLFIPGVTGLGAASRVAGRTVMHHAIPREILKRLPAHIADNPLVRGCRRYPNRWPIAEDLHKAIHRGARAERTIGNSEKLGKHCHRGNGPWKRSCKSVINLSGSTGCRDTSHEDLEDSVPLRRSVRGCELPRQMGAREKGARHVRSALPRDRSVSSP